MKGFARIFEAIIASVILLASLTFFFIPTTQKSSWGDVSLQILAEDALESAYLNGTLTRYVKTDNRTTLNAYMSDMLPKTVEFSIEVSGIPNSIIYIACVDCAPTDMSELAAILNPTEFSYKGRNISIRIENLTLADSPIPEGTNILFFFDKVKIKTHETKINTSLGQGKSVFLLSNLVEDDTKGIIGSMFNLTWTGSTSSASSMFDQVTNSSKVSHFVARYYANISGRQLQNVESDTFDRFNANGIRAENDVKNIVKVGNYAFARANYKIINSNGRTVWLADYTRTDHSNGFTKTMDNLTKASIMWASGERFKLDIIKKYPAPVNLRSSIFVYDEDTYVVELILWRVFF